jgi:hypothetical protein
MTRSISCEVAGCRPLNAELLLPPLLTDRIVDTNELLLLPTLPTDETETEIASTLSSAVASPLFVTVSLLVFLLLLLLLPPPSPSLFLPLLLLLLLLLPLLPL